MELLTTTLNEAARLIFSADSALLDVVGLSLYVTISAVCLGSLIGLPLGAACGVLRFPGRLTVTLAINALMGLPPVVVGLLVYLLLSAAGPLGVLGLLYTPGAMIIAQTLLVIPIIAALSRQITADLEAEYRDQFTSLRVSARHRLGAVLWDARFGLMTVLLAGFGRAISEVGAVMIVGGNINHVTRVMTTTIALETSRGNLELALALGLILLTIALCVNALVMTLRGGGERVNYA